ncbi:hypothetical protein [Chryseobacterium aquaticum]|uniref:Uncharacterized protein n=1 Tax=Chryseobacterium aquaticum subsp. greenlandense TaxID=345663 RepID=A0A101CI09_9FLAO|nr:hypothetical protein [Chryseobacterium aquaticum]KUJ56380.1 hypothetical protein AR686_07400 [Chryseobacterium aquaticum subsp. greenlandense]
MRKFIFFLAFAIPVVSFAQNVIIRDTIIIKESKKSKKLRYKNRSGKVHNFVSRDNTESSAGTFFYLSNIAKVSKFIDENKIPYGTSEVLMEDEMIKLFDPDRFKCDCDEKLSKKIKSNIISEKGKNSAEKLGFVPRLVRDRIENTPAIKLSGMGSTILANSFNFTYVENGKEVNKSASVMNAPTAKNFVIENYLELNYSNFLYNLDCSGYLSAVLSANLSASAASIESSARGAFKSNNSLMILSGVMYSPLYQCYKGDGVFLNKDKETLTARRDVIAHIIKALPNVANNDSTVVDIPFDYRIILTSNKGDSNFNGEASLSAKVGAGFGFGSFAANGNTGGQISRKSNFADFDCYVIKINHLNQPDKITVLDLKTLLKELDSELALL